MHELFTDFTVPGCCQSVVAPVRGVIPLSSSFCCSSGVSQVYQAFEAEGYAVAYHRVPVTDESPPRNGTSISWYVLPTAAPEFPFFFP